MLYFPWNVLHSWAPTKSHKAMEILAEQLKVVQESSKFIPSNPDLLAVRC